LLKAGWRREIIVNGAEGLGSAGVGR